MKTRRVELTAGGKSSAEGKIQLPTRLGPENSLTASLQKGKPPPHECPGYDTKQSDFETPVMLELWGMQSTPPLPSLLGPLLPVAVSPDKGSINGLNRTKPWFLEFTFFCI